jgi:hypothetical protein
MLPRMGDDIQNKWVALARDFVADIQNRPYTPYLTLYDGWRYQRSGCVNSFVYELFPSRSGIIGTPLLSPGNG